MRTNVLSLSGWECRADRAFPIMEALPFLRDSRHRSICLEDGQRDDSGVELGAILMDLVKSFYSINISACFIYQSVSGNGRCETGDCGRGLACNGAGGVTPVTLAEFTLDGNGGQDFYDISLVDGYNLPMEISLQGNYNRDNSGGYRCTTAGCVADLNAQCPGELAVGGINLDSMFKV